MRDEQPKTRRHSAQMKDRVVRAVLEHEAEYASRWAATQAIADMFELSPETVRGWVNRAEVSPSSTSRPVSEVQPARRRGRPPGLSSQDTRARILQAARHCMAEHGSRATTRMIAAQSGVTNNAIYNYFPSKRALFDAVIELNELSFYSSLEAAMLEQSSLDDELVAMVEALARFLDENPYFSVLLARAMPRLLRSSDPIPPRPQRFYDDMVARALARGDIRPGEAESIVGFVELNLMGIVMLRKELRQSAIAGAKWAIVRRPPVTPPRRRRPATADSAEPV